MSCFDVRIWFIQRAAMTDHVSCKPPFELLISGFNLQGYYTQLAACVLQVIYTDILWMESKRFLHLNQFHCNGSPSVPIQIRICAHTEVKSSVQCLFSPLEEVNM